MAFDRTRTVRGALAGGVAAAVWAAQEPLDMKVFGVAYSDTRLLGSAVSRGRAARAPGWLVHVGNGAAFGALYANVAPSVPLPAALRGPAAGLGEHLATWPFTRFIPRLASGRDVPQLWGSRRALAQATWRHLLFGVVLGELERRLNPPRDADAEADARVAAAMNGHTAGGHVVAAEAPSAAG